MKWLVALLISAVMSLLLLDLGLFQRERLLIADVLASLPVIGWPIPFVRSFNADDASPDARLMISTITLIVGLYAGVRLLLEALPPRWFKPDDGRVGRLPDPRLLRDRVRNHESNPRLKKLVHVTNGTWMVALATILMFFLLVSMPVALLDRAYYWVWGLSLLVPIAFYCCGLNPDRPRNITMTTPELKEYLTPRSLPDDASRRTLWRRLRTVLRTRRRRLRSFFRSKGRHRSTGPAPQRPADDGRGEQQRRAEAGSPASDEDEPPPATGTSTGATRGGPFRSRVADLRGAFRPARLRARWSDAVRRRRNHPPPPA